MSIVSGADRFGRSGATDSGTSTRNTVPVPGRVVTISGCPSSPQIRLTIDSPRPKPVPLFSAFELSPR